MRGEVDVFDASAGVGVIAGVDGARYRFAVADLAGASVNVGATVDFDAGDDGRAQNITIARIRAGTGQFDLGRVIERTFSSIGKNWAVFFGAATLVVGVPSLIAAWGQMSLTTDGGSIIGVLATLLGSAFYIFGLYVLQGMVMKAVVNGFHGKATAFSGAFDAGLKVALPLIGLAIIAGLGIGLGFLLLIVPGVFLCVIWCVAAPVLVVEKRDVTECLSRSSDLTKGHRWPVLGLLVIYFVLSSVIGLAVGGINLAAGAGFAGTVPNLWVTLITGPLVNILSGVIAAAGAAALYYELRTAKEGVIAEDLLSVFD